MNKSKRPILLKLVTITVLAGAGLIGGAACRSPDRQPVPPPPPPPRADRMSEEQRALQDLALEIQVAPTAAEEAEAIREFQEYLTRRGWTYTINTYRVNENLRVAAPTVQPFPVRAVIDVHRGRERLYQFVFIPKDNQNLGLLIA